MPNRDPIEAMADFYEPDNAHLSRIERDRCQLCDDDGYRPNGTVCDHVDYSDIARRGMAKVRAALAKDSKR
ncbi:hypothetical protein MSP7336_01819 [Mycobacterium shimoidei]|uniref:Uncharacterized protein n=1 Tax=Mycobacterium shimoidei TaxID=29313 RepID=A0A375YY04_MYCSH|nr:hypothetical protein [Mycobacterium shimoidei]SRX93580.1 hypothetical protein MSP7336_01819 [Mycobacterium shimoidei]